MKFFNVVLLVLIAFSFWSCGGDDPPKTFTVTFISNGGTPEPQKQTIEQGGKVSEPEVMTKNNYSFFYDNEEHELDGWYFDGWYKEKDFSNKWNFDNDNVSTNITLYAKWEIRAYGIIIPVRSVTGILPADFDAAKDKLMEAIAIFEDAVSANDSNGIKFIDMASREGFEIIIGTGNAGPDADANKSMTIGVDYLLAPENIAMEIAIGILDKVEANSFAD